MDNKENFDINGLGFEVNNRRKSNLDNNLNKENFAFSDEDKPEKDTDKKAELRK